MLFKKFVSFETFVANFPLTKNGYAKMNIGTNYLTTLSFKDGKIKYESYLQKNID